MTDQLPSFEFHALAAVVEDNECFSLLRAALQPDHFTDKRLRTVFEAMTALREGDPGCPLDVAAVKGQLQKAGNLHKAGGQEVLDKLNNSAALPANAHYYCEKIREEAARRQASLMLGPIIGQITNGEISLPAASGEIARRLQALTQTTESLWLPGPAEDVHRLFDKIELWNAGKEEVGTPSGIPLIDENLLGLRRGTLVVLGARTSGGKSALAQTITAGVCRRGGKIVYHSPEMRKLAIYLRLLAMLTGINPCRFQQRNGIDKSEWPIVVEQCNALSKWLLRINDNPLMTANDVSMKSILARDQMKGLDVVIVDYLQAMNHNLRDGNRPDLAITQTLLSLIEIARQLNVAVLLLSQFNRECDGYAEPKVSQLKESSSIEQLADAVLLLHRPPDQLESAELILAKNREGPIGRAHLRFDPTTTLFEPVIQTSAYQPGMVGVRF